MSTTATTQPREFEFLPGQPKYGKLVVTCLNKRTYANLKGWLCKPKIICGFSEVSFNDSYMEVTFKNAAVTNISNGQVDIREGQPGLGGVVSFEAANNVLINGLGLRTADLERSILVHKHD